MDNLIISSHGFRLGRWYFPPFSVRRGECATLDFPQEALASKDSIVDALTGAAPVDGLELRASVTFAAPVFGPSGWRRWFDDPTPAEWLKKNTMLSDDSINSILREFAMDRQLPLSRFAGNPRLILGLHAAYARNPGAVVFATTGLDPSGVQTAFRIVAKHLTHCGTVYLAWRFICQGQEQHVSVPGSLNISVSDVGSSSVQSDAPASK